LDAGYALWQDLVPASWVKRARTVADLERSAVRHQAEALVNARMIR
jgi:hypothetical protein